MINQTPIFLQKELKKILEQEFKGYFPFDTKKEKKSLEIHEQYVPDNFDKKLPYILIKIDSGDDSGEVRNTKIIFVICIYDDSVKYSGYKQCMQIIERIYQILAKENIISGFSIDYPIKWELPEEDYYPYFFGGIETTWESTKINMKDDEYC